MYKQIAIGFELKEAILLYINNYIVTGQYQNSL